MIKIVDVMFDQIFGVGVTHEQWLAIGLASPFGPTGWVGEESPQPHSSAARVDASLPLSL